MKRTLKIVAIIIGVLIVLVIALPFFVDVNMFRPEIESELTSALGRQVKVGNLKLSILTGSVSADDLSIGDDPAFSTAPFVRAKGLDVGVEVMPLIFSKALHITDLTITEPQVSLLRNASGRWNFSSLGSKPASEAAATGRPAEAGKAPEATTSAKEAAGRPSTTEKAARPANNGETAPPSPARPSSTSASANPNLSVGKLVVKNGSVSVANISTHAKPQVYKNVDINVQNFSFASKFPLTLSAGLPGGGSVKLDGMAGPIDASDASLTPLEAKLNVKNLDLAASGFVEPSSGIGGVADFDGSVTSNGHQAQSSGTATIAKLKLSPKGSPAPRPVEVKYSTTYELQKQVGQLQGDVTVGKAVAKLSGEYRIEGATTVVNMKLNAPNMPVEDLEAMLPALGVTLPAGSHLQGGTLTADFTITGPVDKLVITGPVQLANTKLTGFDLGSKLSAISALSGVKTGQDTIIQNFSALAHVSPQGIDTQNVNLTVPSIGVITGNGSISPQNTLNYHMAAKLSGNVVTGLSQLAGLGNKGTTIPFFIQGTTSDPKFVPDVKGIVGSQFNAATQGQNPSGLVDSITGLFGKKKKP